MSSNCKVCKLYQFKSENVFTFTSAVKPFQEISQLGEYRIKVFQYQNKLTCLTSKIYLNCFIRKVKCNVFHKAKYINCFNIKVK